MNIIIVDIKCLKVYAIIVNIDSYLLAKKKKNECHVNVKFIHAKISY